MFIHYVIQSLRDEALVCFRTPSLSSFTELAIEAQGNHIPVDITRRCGINIQKLHLCKRYISVYTLSKAFMTTAEYWESGRLPRQGNHMPVDIHMKCT